MTKVEETDDACRATRKKLDELQLDHADLMLIHRLMVLSWHAPTSVPLEAVPAAAPY